MCHFCHVSFNILFKKNPKSRKYSIPSSARLPDGDNGIAIDTEYLENDDSEDADFMYESEDDGNDPYEYDSSYESEDASDCSDTHEDEISSVDSTDVENRWYRDWIVMSFDYDAYYKWGFCDDYLKGLSYIDFASTSYTLDPTETAQYAGCRTAQFMIRREDHETQDPPGADLTEPWEAQGMWIRSGICDGAPSRTGNRTEVWSGNGRHIDVVADNIICGYVHSFFSRTFGFFFSVLSGPSRAQPKLSPVCFIS